MKQATTILLLLIGLVTVSCAQQTNYSNVRAAEFKRLVESNPGTLLDVRTLQEFRGGRLENADMLNYYDRDFRERLLMLPKNKPVYLYCNTGYRSERAARVLAAAGYSNVYNMQFGIMEWYHIGLPLYADPNARQDTENLYSIADFRSILSKEPLVFVDFYAPWCAPCREMMPMIDELLPQYHADIHLLKVNVDASRDLARDLGLKGVPYLVLYQNGKAVFEHFGTISREELKKVLDRQLAKAR